MNLWRWWTLHTNSIWKRGSTKTEAYQRHLCFNPIVFLCLLATKHPSTWKIATNPAMGFSQNCKIVGTYTKISLKVYICTKILETNLNWDTYSKVPFLRALSFWVQELTTVQFLDNSILNRENASTTSTAIQIYWMISKASLKPIWKAWSSKLSPNLKALSFSLLVSHIWQIHKIQSQSCIMCTSLYQVINKSLMISIVFTMWWGMRIRRIHKYTGQTRNSITRIGTNIIKYTYLENTSSCRDPLLDLGSLMHSLLMNSKDHHILQNPLNFLHLRSH